jgi:hypothetical protein
MSITLYLIETQARNEYICPACLQKIPKGVLHFRHDPYPAARRFRGESTTHWCRQCIMASDPGPKERITGRIRIPVFRVMGRQSPAVEAQLPLPLFAPLRVELVGIGAILSEQLTNDPSLLYRVSPEEFEEFICDRLFAMGFEPRRVGATNRKDGGVDVLFWPRLSGAFPFLGAAQVKHHRDTHIKEGPGTVRDFAGTIAGHPFNAGLLITNTSFTPDAEWFAREHAKLLRLRAFNDIRRWLFNNFGDEAEWREVPTSIELCPGVVIKIR